MSMLCIDSVGIDYLGLRFPERSRGFSLLHAFKYRILDYYSMSRNDKTAKIYKRTDVE